MRFAHLIIGLLVIVFAWVTAPSMWGRWVLSLLGLLQVILAFSGPGGGVQRKHHEPKPEKEIPKPE